MSVVTTRCEKLGSATGGGEGGSFQWEECLTELVESWALILGMIDCRCLAPLPGVPIYYGQLPVACRR